MAYEPLLKERIWDVLGLSDTTISLSTSQRQRLASGYSGVIPIPNWDFDALAGAGAIRSTPKDMLAFVAANLGQNAGRLYPAMINAHRTRITAAPGFKVGLAWHILEAGGRQFVFHDGQTGGYSALIAFEEASGKGVAVLASGFGVASDVGFYLLDSSLGPLTSYPVPLVLPPDLLRSYVGKFQSVQGDSFLAGEERDHLTIKTRVQNRHH